MRAVFGLAVGAILWAAAASPPMSGADAVRGHPLVSYVEEGGIKFRRATALVSAAGRATVTAEGRTERFRIGPPLRRRLRAALRHADLHAIAGDYPAPPGAADFITYTITSGHDTVRVTSVMPKRLSGRLRSLLDVLGKIVRMGERRAAA